MILDKRPRIIRRSLSMNLDIELLNPPRVDTVEEVDEKDTKMNKKKDLTPKGPVRKNGDVEDYVYIGTPFKHIQEDRKATERLFDLMATQNKPPKLSQKLMSGFDSYFDPVSKEGNKSSVDGLSKSKKVFRIIKPVNYIEKNKSPESLAVHSRKSSRPPSVDVSNWNNQMESQAGDMKAFDKKSKHFRTTSLKLSQAVFYNNHKNLPNVSPAGQSQLTPSGKPNLTASMVLPGPILNSTRTVRKLPTCTANIFKSFTGNNDSHKNSHKSHQLEDQSKRQPQNSSHSQLPLFKATLKPRKRLQSDNQIIPLKQNKANNPQSKDVFEDQGFKAVMGRLRQRAISQSTQEPEKSPALTSPSVEKLKVSNRLLADRLGSLRASNSALFEEFKAVINRPLGDRALKRMGSGG